MVWHVAAARGLAILLCALGLASTAVGAAGSAPATGADRLQVQSIAIAEQGPATRVDLKLTRIADYNLFTLSNPARVVIDISSAALGRSALPLPAATGVVRQVRVAYRPGGSLRIVFDLVEPRRPSATFGGDAGGPHLAIDLQPLSLMGAVPAPARAPAPASGLQSPPPASASTSIPAPDVPESATLPAATAPSPPRDAAASGEVARPPDNARDIVVVVDAGHGGHDPGAHGPSGVREKDVTLAISRRLVALLNAEPGMRGVLTRSDDRFLGLRERMERARSVNANLFISIHADAAYNRSAQGSTVYVLSEKAASDEASRRLAARENAALIGGVDLGDKDPVLASVLMDLSQNASISSSIAVGESILGHMRRLGRLHRTSVQLAPFMVLKSPDVPSVLLETAYISNPTDEQNLQSPAHQQELAQAVLDGLKKYFAANPPGNAISRAPTTVAATPGLARPDQHVVRRGETLSGVASLYSVSLSSLRAANRLRSDTVWVGQKLRIPREST